MPFSAFGFGGKDAARYCVAGDSLEAGVRLPDNTHAGLLCEATMHGLKSIIEGPCLTWDSSCNQASRTDHVLVFSGVGVATDATIPGHD